MAIKHCVGADGREGALAEHTEESLSLIHSLPTFPATLATSQSAAVIAGCDRVQSILFYLLTPSAQAF